MQNKKIAIVGGGTAGWLAANHMGLELGTREGVSITVIESPDIPTIGVGEGTVAVIRNSLEKLGISEAQLLLRCQTTLKMGIKFVDWLAPKSERTDNFFYHPFDPPYPAGVDATDYWLDKGKTGFSQLTKSYRLAEKNLSPKLRGAKPYRGEVGYAYHFDARKFAELLAENARKRFGIHYQQQTVTSANLDEKGYIQSLNYADGNCESFDFYVDCSGFSSLIIGQTLEVPWVDKSEQILPDQALALQVPTAPEADLAPYTTATAHSAGWIWDIPLTTRRGTGFVYSSSHMTEQQAVADFARYHGEDFNENYLRKIPMKTGYRRSFWQKNCVALGLAQGFVEPLEATSIVITDYCAALIARLLPERQEDMPARSQQVNRRVEYIWERVIDFIQLHYCISDRRDSNFWRDCTDRAVMSDVLQERLALWETYTPMLYDFSADIEFFQRESYLCILYGMEYSTRPVGRLSDYDVFVESKIREHAHTVDQLERSLIGQRQWLNELYAYAAHAQKTS
ncbi:tryptophan 7-halogenase [Gilvimarinus agarilyticus]|uniref:tryptophan halogenase family protein n=1 Tax=Gilvimarinus sp. 2_MG-2023 TaxID=3062666 RepID=UPI001C0949A2|nr:tryptophan halogenase family protein [Gilvimarinus sp. 2_MG-2023]MBU2884665.1 tryptophan 7-halogenase [Gilvimarinus agarilyticus]MDO6569772.1 tryptophan 7-halogenase [Gilvimarinus sp. 2_MG-2023]